MTTPLWLGVGPIDRWLTRTTNPAWMRLLRLSTGGYCLALLLALAPHWLHLSRLPATAFRPVGILTHLSGPLPAGVLFSLWLVTTALSVLFALGIKARIVGPAFGLSLLVLTTYRSSWGVLYHTENLVVLHVLLLAWLPFVPKRRWGVILNCLQLATVTTYWIAAYAKAELGGWAWLTGDALANQVAFDTLKKTSLGAYHSPLATWTLRHPRLFPPLAAATLATEWFAPLSLVGRRWAQAWCAAAWLFHAGVLATLAIAFPYPLSGCGLICLASPQGIPRLLKNPILSRFIR